MRLIEVVLLVKEVMILPEKELDKLWFWLGYACGARTRNEIKESDSRIENLSPPSIPFIPNATQANSFNIGLRYGYEYVIQNLNKVKVVQKQDKKDRNPKGEWLCLGMTEVKGDAGETITMPVSICNNSADNRGYIGFQAKISYSKTYLTFNNVTQANPNLTTFNYRHDAVNGVVSVQGMMDKVSYSDAVQFYMSFTVSTEAKTSQTIYMNGPTGTGSASDILTLIDDELYYIQPLKLEDGKIKFPEKEEEEEEEEDDEEDVERLPSIGDDTSVFSPNSSFSYDFTLGLTYGGSASGSGGGGSGGSGSGARLGVTLTFSDGSSYTYYIDLEEGEHHYEGKIPTDLPSLKEGPVEVEIWVEPEDEDDLYYWYIKAGAIWGFEDEIPCEAVGEFEVKVEEIVKKKPKTYYETLMLYDAVDFVYEGITPLLDTYYVDDYLTLSDYVYIEFEGSPPIPATDLTIDDIMQIFDTFGYEWIKKSVSFDDFEADDVGIVDEVIFNFE